MTDTHETRELRRRVERIEAFLGTQGLPDDTPAPTPQGPTTSEPESRTPLDPWTTADNRCRMTAAARGRCIRPEGHPDDALGHQYPADVLGRPPSRDAH